MKPPAAVQKALKRRLQEAAMATWRRCQSQARAGKYWQELVDTLTRKGRLLPDVAEAVSRALRNQRVPLFCGDSYLTMVVTETYFPPGLCISIYKRDSHNLVMVLVVRTKPWRILPWQTRALTSVSIYDLAEMAEAIVHAVGNTLATVILKETQKEE